MMPSYTGTNWAMSASATAWVQIPPPPYTHIFSREPMVVETGDAGSKGLRKAILRHTIFLKVV